MVESITGCRAFKEREGTQSTERLEETQGAEGYFKPPQRRDMPCSPRISLDRQPPPSIVAKLMTG